MLSCKPTESHQIMRNDAGEPSLASRLRSFQILVKRQCLIQSVCMAGSGLSL